MKLFKCSNCQKMGLSKFEYRIDELNYEGTTIFVDNSTGNKYRCKSCGDAIYIKTEDLPK